jgi:hypothetical protein
MEAHSLALKKVFSFFIILPGEASISELEDRFNPPNISNDGDLFIFCQK